MRDVYEARRGSIQDYVKAFRSEAGQVGAVFAVDGRVAGLELFDAPATFAKMLEKILTSYVVDALEEEKEIAPPAELTVREFIERLKAAAGRNYPAIGCRRGTSE